MQDHSVDRAPRRSGSCHRPQALPSPAASVTRSVSAPHQCARVVLDAIDAVGIGGEHHLDPACRQARPYSRQTRPLNSPRRESPTARAIAIAGPMTTVRRRG
jgi:hypothetical protein